MRKLSAWAAHRAGNLRLPPGYRLERDADLLELRKTDGSLVAAFSVRGASPAAVWCGKPKKTTGGTAGAPPDCRRGGTYGGVLGKIRPYTGGGSTAHSTGAGRTGVPGGESLS